MEIKRYKGGMVKGGNVLLKKRKFSEGTDHKGSRVFIESQNDLG